MSSLNWWRSFTLFSPVYTGTVNTTWRTCCNRTEDNLLYEYYLYFIFIKKLALKVQHAGWPWQKKNWLGTLAIKHYFGVQNYCTLIPIMVRTPLWCWNSTTSKTFLYSQKLWKLNFWHNVINIELYFDLTPGDWSLIKLNYANKKKIWMRWLNMILKHIATNSAANFHLLLIKSSWDK